MTHKQRLVFLVLTLAVLVAVGITVTGSMKFLLEDFWFSAGLLMLILLSVVDQPHFSKDANVFVNGVTGLVALVSVRLSGRDWLWYAFLCWSLYLVLASYVIMLSRSRELGAEPRWLQALSRTNREIGRPEALFSAFFLWGVLSQFGQNASAFKCLLLFWAVFMILNLPAVARSMATLLEPRTAPVAVPLGVVTHLLSPRILDCELDPQSASLPRGTSTTIHLPDGTLAARAAVLEDRVLPGSRYARLAVTETTDAWRRLADSSARGAVFVRLSESPTVPSSLEVVGVVGKGTSIEYLELLVDPGTNLQEGEVLRVCLPDGRNAYYQIVAARVVDSSAESDRALEYIGVTASQLGVWERARARFEPVAWVAPPGGLVSKVGLDDQIEACIPSDCLEVGQVPNSSFPVHLNLQDAVTHNTAIIGVTGSGKSYLAFHAIEAMIQAGIKVLILDLSRQHWIFLTRHNPFPLKAVSDVAAWFKGNQPLAIHQFADAKSYPQRTSELAAAIFAEMAKSVKLRAGANEPARACLVLEEAHSLIPEWNQVAERQDSNHVNETARTILQGRKYGLGCLLITQRTANVTKTILNQCNTIFALQSFDQTGLDFLKNYMGESYAHTISTLPVRHSILVGKASSSTRPIMFGIADLGSHWPTSTEGVEEPPNEPVEPTA